MNGLKRFVSIIKVLENLDLTKPGRESDFSGDIKN
jgi:hypothetical protein